MFNKAKEESLLQNPLKLIEIFINSGTFILSILSAAISKAGSPNDTRVTLAKRYCRRFGIQHLSPRVAAFGEQRGL